MQGQSQLGRGTRDYIAHMDLSTFLDYPPRACYGNGAAEPTRMTILAQAQSTS